MRLSLLFSMVVLASLAGGEAVRAAPRGKSQQNPTVTIECKALEGKSGAALKVLQTVTPGGLMREIPHSAAFDDKGLCKVEIPPGEYRFEVLYFDKPGTFIALKTSPRTIANPTTIQLAALDPQPIQLETRKSNDPPVPLMEIAIRSEAPTGEICWNAERDGKTPPRIVASPNQRYRLRLIGENDTTHVALWLQTTSNDWSLRTTGRGVTACRFQVRKDGPEFHEAGVIFAFPDGKIEFPVNSKSVFITNRRFLSFACWVDLTTNRRVEFNPQLGEIRNNQVFKFGGPLKPIAWAAVMKRTLIDKPETQHLLGGADLCDPQGYLVNPQKSQIAWKVSVNAPWGPVSADEELTPEHAKAFKGGILPVKVEVSYKLDSPYSSKLSPVAFRKYAIPNFDTTAPPHWGLQAVNYLAKVRRVYGSIEEYEMKPAKHRITVGWHNTGGVAWGGGGGITMPFYELCDSFDHYAEPWAIVHEMLHTFGYGHDERMDRGTKAVSQRLDWFRWYMADHPELDPGPGFNLFRLAQRGV
jgi:hypothetical protein